MADPYANAISGIESGGRYDLLGPPTKGDRAYGRYQVMGDNIPDWTAKFYGQKLTPQEFLNNPQAQDAVFQGQFGQYVQKYGPEGAAKAWFAGESGMNNPNAKDVLGTTVSGYGQKFMSALGPNFSSFNQPPLTPGSPAPGLPPPINIGQQPQQSPGILAGLPGQQNQQQQQTPGLLSLASMGQQQTPQMAQAPPLAVPQAFKPQIDMTQLLKFLQARQQSGPSSWSLT